MDSRTYTPTELYVGYHWPADIFCRIFLGFILFELGLQTLGSHALRYLTAFLHHIGFAILGFYCIHYSLLPLPFSWLCFGELSTIFLNLRWALRCAELTGSCVLLSRLDPRPGMQVVPGHVRSQELVLVQAQRRRVGSRFFRRSDRRVRVGPLAHVGLKVCCALCEGLLTAFTALIAEDGKHAEQFWPSTGRCQRLS